MVPKVNGKGSTPLHIAAEHGRLSVAKLLLERGADPKKVNEDGDTPLSLARENGHQEVFTLLRRRRAADP